MAVETITLDFRSPLPNDGRRGFARWVRALDGQNGVYLIRDFASAEVLYVGESHTERLYDTLTRHLQQWNGFGSGPTFQPERVEVAVILTDEPRDAVYLQYTLIQEYQPPYNDKDGRSLFMPAVVIDDDGGDIPF